jgi:hypothetical protein
MPIILATWEAKIGRITVQDGLGKNWDPISKITRAKGIGGVSQVVELLMKCKALSSNSRTAKKIYINK